MIIMDCPRCGMKISEQDEHVGQMTTCTNCGALCEVPNLSFTDETISGDELRRLREDIDPEE